MKLYTLTGKSGTGKSFHAMNLCRKMNIEAIIDDGLFICDNVVIEGVSAKKSETKVGAIKTALFFDEGQAESMRQAIRSKSPRSLLIIGTSDEMTDKIMGRLELLPEEGSPVKRIYIEDITSEEERSTAHYQRSILGKHVIPAPSLQLKKNFAGYFIDPLRLFRGKDLGAASERTVVRPPFSYLGDYILEERVIDDIVICAAKMTPGIHRVIYIGHASKPESYELSISVKIQKGYPVWETAGEFQRIVNDSVEKMTAFNVARVDCEVRGMA